MKKRLKYDFAIFDDFIGYLNKKFWQPVTNIVNISLDFATSTSVGRIVMVASTLLLFVTSPVAPWLIGIAVAGAVGSIACGLIIESYSRYTLAQLHKEDRILNNLITSKAETRHLLDHIKSKDPQVRESLERKLYRFNGDRYKIHEVSPLRNFVETAIFTGPERFANILISIITMNPISIVNSIGMTILSYKSSVQITNQYNDKKATLLNHMEQAKQALDISYESGSGLSILKDVSNLRLSENIALKNLSNNLEQGMNSAQAMEEFDKQRNLLFQSFSKQENNKSTSEIPPQDQALLQSITTPPNIQIEKQESTWYRVTDFLNTIGKVIFYGFSNDKTLEEFSPLKGRDDYQAKIVSPPHQDNNQQEITPIQSPTIRLSQENVKKLHKTRTEEKLKEPSPRPL